MEMGVCLELTADTMFGVPVPYFTEYEEWQ